MNDKQKKQMIVLVVLFLGLGVVGYMQFMGGSSTPPRQPASSQTSTAPGAQPATQGPVTTQATSEADLNALIGSIKEVRFDYEMERRAVNPMTPLVGVYRETLASAVLPGGGTAGGTAAPAYELIEKARRMRVTGIVYDSTNPAAVLENEVVGLGDEIAPGIIVDSMEPTRVILKVGNTPVTLELKE